jgi:hypothetical protein
MVRTVLSLAVSRS